MQVFFLFVMSRRAKICKQPTFTIETNKICTFKKKNKQKTFYINKIYIYFKRDQEMQPLVLILMLLKRRLIKKINNLLQYIVH